MEDRETLKDGLRRELEEEIGFTENFKLIITHYFDEIKKSCINTWFRDRLYCKCR